jgi:dipeptidase E
MNKKVFLSSMFSSVSSLFETFANEEFKGKTVTFIPTASIPETVKFFVSSGKKALIKLGLTVDELEISTATNEEISNKLKNNDLIYVSGGNTFFLLQELKRTGADRIIAEQINSGKIYIGESAGSIIVSPDIEYVKYLDSVKKAPNLSDFSSLNIVEFYPLPHYTNFPFKKSVEKVIAEYGNTLELMPFSNSQAIFIKDYKVEIVTK